MRFARAALIFVMASGLSACDRDAPPQQQPSDPPPPAGQITGRERLAWDQEAANADELTGFRYILWIDGNSGPMASVACGPFGNQVASCSGALREMTPGRHLLALSVIRSDGTESSRSSSLEVSVSGAGSLTFGGEFAAVADPTAAGETSADGTIASSRRAVVDLLTDQLMEPTDLATTPDGRLFIAERRGVIREWANGALRPEPVLALEDVWTAGGSGLLSLALAPDFHRSGFVYVGYSAETGFRVARYRVVDGMFGERATVFETVPDVAYTSAEVRFGPDGRLYLALDDEGDADRAGDLGSYSGKVLRLDTDGGVPDDQPGYTPVYLANVHDPRGLDWAAPSGTLWLADGGTGTGGTLAVARADVGAGQRAAIVGRFALPDGDLPSSALFYRGNAFQDWTGDLLVGLTRSGRVLRLRVDPADPAQVTSSEVVLDVAVGTVRDVVVDAAGLVYVAGDRHLLRLTPRGEVR